MTAATETQLQPTDTTTETAHFVCTGCFPGDRAAWAGKEVKAMCGQVYVAAPEMPSQVCPLCYLITLPTYCPKGHLIGNTRK